MITQRAQCNSLINLKYKKEEQEGRKKVKEKSKKSQSALDLTIRLFCLVIGVPFAHAIRENEGVDASNLGRVL
jgi:hypothetical protein